MILATANLVLRDFTAQDLPAYRRLRADRKFLRFSSEDEATPEKSAQLLQLFIEQSQALPRAKFQLAVTLQDGTLIGSCGIRIEQTGIASIGCEIGREYQGSGFAREAGRALLDFGFRELALEKVYAETIPENLAALRLCRALGLHKVDEKIAARTFHGRSWNTAIYAMTRAQWLAVTSTAGIRP